MKLLTFTIYDEKSEAFGPPFFTPAIGIASRNFSDTVNNSETLISKHPGDFSLYHIGYFDTAKAKFDNNATPTLIGRATDYKTGGDKDWDREVDDKRFKEVKNA